MIPSRRKSQWRRKWTQGQKGTKKKEREPHGIAIDRFSQPKGVDNGELPQTPEYASADKQVLPAEAASNQPDPSSFCPGQAVVRSGPRNGF
jgi:hypothetical protein